MSLVDYMTQCRAGRVAQATEESFSVEMRDARENLRVLSLNPAMRAEAEHSKHEAAWESLKMMGGG